MANRFLNNITINDQYTLPSTDGDADQIIQTDGAGNLSFVDLSSIEGASSNFVYFEVKNETGSPINKGKGVMAVGTDGNSGHILIDEMVADGSVDPKYFLGVLETTVANGGFARVISFGQLDQFNTNGQNGETWSNGQVLWCDPDSAGDFTITEPDGPNVKIPAAFILKASTNGKIQIRVQANEGVKDLYDTKIASQVDGDVLVWDDTTGVWFNDSTLNVDYTAGNVGIGTTSPALRYGGKGLHIENDDTAGINLHDTTGAELDIAARSGDVLIYEQDGYPIRFGIDGTEKMRLTSTGLGIGTTSPNFKLDVNGSTSNAALRLSSTDRYTGINFTDSLDSTNLFYDGQDDLIYTASDFKSADARFTGDAIIDGNVGIGTDSPARKLDVNGGTDNILASFTSTDTAARIEFADSTTSGQVSVGAQGSNFVAFTDSAERMRIDSSGNVGIGTTSPQSKIQVDGGVQMADDTDAASASKVGTLRYRTSGNNSYVDMCMQTGATTYEWVNIVQNNW